MRRPRQTVRRFGGESWQQQGDDVLACAKAAAERVDQLGLRGLFAWHWRQRCISEGADRQFAARIESDANFTDNRLKE